MTHENKNKQYKWEIFFDRWSTCYTCGPNTKNFFLLLLATFYILLPVNQSGGRIDVFPFPPKIPHKDWSIRKLQMELTTTQRSIKSQLQNCQTQQNNCCFVAIGNTVTNCCRTISEYVLRTFSAYLSSSSECFDCHPS